MREHHRTDRVLAEFELMFGALAPAARRALTVAVVALDLGARLYPRARGRRFTQLDDQAAEAYLGALLARGGVAGQLVQRLRGLVVMCYYELPTVQREIVLPAGPLHRSRVPPASHWAQMAVASTGSAPALHTPHPQPLPPWPHPDRCVTG